MSTTQEKKPQVAAAIYARISDDSAGEGKGVRRQQADCEELAKKRGWKVGEVFVDNDISAWSGKNRPAYQRMLEGIANGSIDGVLLYNLDRLTRTPLELEEFFGVCDRAGLKSMATVTGDIDLSTRDGRMHARIMGEVARQASDATSDRLRRKHAELAQLGAPTWGVAVAFGYHFDSDTKKLLPDDERADEVRQMFARYANGWSLKKISRDLNDRGVIGSRGGTRWDSSHVGRMLDNPVFAGFRHHEGALTKGKWEPLVTLDLWKTVRARRLVTKKEKAGSNRSGSGGNALSGLLYCSCGNRMWRNTQSVAWRSSYDCSKASAKRRGECAYGGVGAERVERIVRDAFLERMSDLHGESVSAFEIEEARPTDSSKKRATLERKMDRIIELQLETSGPAATTAFRKKLESIEAELRKIDLETAEQTIGIADIAHRAERLKALRELASSLSSVWDAATREEKNSMLKLVIERVVVGVGRPKRIDIQFAPWLA